MCKRKVYSAAGKTSPIMPSWCVSFPASILGRVNIKTRRYTLFLARQLLASFAISILKSPYARRQPLQF
ncbi:hypothetical protein KCP71_25200 [Salmonella enterica subsp. enterica]|nr:hypothetical protein KCP71_25200 [Salmonella enterica subsp. enterica]